MRWSSLCARRTIRGFVVGLVTGIHDQELSFAGWPGSPMFGMYDGRTLQLLELDSSVVQGLDVPVGARRRDLAAAAAGAGLTLHRLKGGTDLRSAP